MVAMVRSPFVSSAKDAPALVATDLFAVIGGQAVLADSDRFAAIGFAGKLVLRSAPGTYARALVSPALLAHGWLAPVVHNQNLHLRGCVCSKRNTYSKLPDHILSCVTPYRNGIDDTLAAGAMPALDLSQESASRFEDERREVILGLVELRHERSNHDTQQSLLHGKRAYTLSEWGALLVPGKALVSLKWGM